MTFRPDEIFFQGLPTAPGVYIMKNSDGEVIYVGKAKNIRTRVRQYFRDSGDSRFFVAGGFLARALSSVECVVVGNEKEALLLENQLIKKHRPRFNVKLRDDKQYLVLRIDTRVPYPRVEAVRNIKNDGADYFGPYHTATSCRRTLRVLNRHFQLRTCTDHVLKTRKRVCLQYQIGRCPGPCVYDIPKEEYAEQVRDVLLFLSGKEKQLQSRLGQRMTSFSNQENFESAARTRDSLHAIKQALSKQIVVQKDFPDLDVFALHREGDKAFCSILFVRAGKLHGTRSFTESNQEFPDEDVMGAFLQQYYASETFTPPQILTSVAPTSKDLLALWLSEMRNGKVVIQTPSRGPKRALLKLARQNAEALSKQRSPATDIERTLKKIQTRLHLSRPPRRVECIDIAHIQGQEPVASLVVFIDGYPDKSLYKKFNIKTATNDDFRSMYEVCTRRIKRLGQVGWEKPDLLIVDGGRGQLGSAVAAARDQNLPLGGEAGVDIVGLAKDRQNHQGEWVTDRVFHPQIKDPIVIRRNTPELYLLMQLRDEAHRFANTFHRTKRKNSTLRSALDEIPGVGPSKRKALLTHFGSLKKIREASVEELTTVPGISQNLATVIREQLKRPR